jgi:hypothetical protein
MKKITLLFAFCVAALMANAQIFLDEKFPDFPTSDQPSTVTLNGWTNSSLNIGQPNLTDSRTLNAPLNYADVSGVPALSGLGASIFNNYKGVSGNNYMTYKQFSATPITTGTVYMSFLWNVYAAGGSQGEVVGLTDSIQRNTCRMWIRPSTSSSFILGFTRSSGTAADIHNSTGPTYNYGQTYFVVLKYDLATKIGSVFMNPVIGSTTEPTPTIMDDGIILPVSTSIPRTALQYLMFRNGGSNKAYYYVSGIRVCSSWTDAVAALALPKVTTPTVKAASSVNIEDFTANWTPTTDCAGYTVLVYNGATLFSKTDVPDKTASSVQITGLISNTTYTYEVQAKGDNTATGNSLPSAASASFTTGDGQLSLAPDFGDGNWGTPYANSAAEPLSGSFPTFTTPTGYTVQNGLWSTSSKVDITGVTMPNIIKLDRSGGLVVGAAALVLPSMKAVQRVEIHAWTTRRLRTFQLQALGADGNWTATESWITAGDTINHIDSMFISTKNHPIGTKLRILNTSSGSLWIGILKVDASYTGLTNNYTNGSLYAVGKTIISSEPGMLSIYNLQGGLISKDAIENKRITTLKTGLYVVRLTGRDGLTVTRKLLIQ